MKYWKNQFEEIIDKNKIRIIHKLDFYPHRIIQHAILQVMEKKWKPSLIKNTYQSIKHRGIVKCKRDVEKCLKRMAKVNKGNDTYVVKLDVAKYLIYGINIIKEKRYGDKTSRRFLPKGV